MFRLLLFSLCLFPLLSGCPSPTLPNADPSDASGHSDGEDVPNSESTGPAREEPEDAPEAVACPSAVESFAFMIPATYAVVIQYKSPDDPEETEDVFVGTAFAVDSWLLGTNAHVIEALIEPVRPIRRIVALQASTGRMVEVSVAVTHPSYTGDPIASPDVGVLVSVEELADHLELASDHEVTRLDLGNELATTGFPGDVGNIFEIVVGQSVPQATALTGSVSALRSFDPNVPVTGSILDIIQHQTPTTPGTSGSPLLYCGKVVAVHNAGTQRLVFTVGSDGRLQLDRQTEAANSFGIHVKYLRALVDRVYEGSVTGRSLPPPPPRYGGTYHCRAFAADGSVNHVFSFTVESSGSVAGTSTWSGGAVYSLTGQVDEFGRLEMADAAAGFGETPTRYEGWIDAVSRLTFGFYFTGPSDSSTGSWETSL